MTIEVSGILREVGRIDTGRFEDIKAKLMWLFQLRRQL